MAYDLHLYYDGYPADTLERCQEKIKFERERLLNLRNQGHLDTFEKFLDFTEEEEVIQEHKKNIVNNSDSKNTHCTVCKVLLGQNQKFLKD